MARSRIESWSGTPVNRSDLISAARNEVFRPVFESQGGNMRKQAAAAIAFEAGCDFWFREGRHYIWPEKARWQIIDRAYQHAKDELRKTKSLLGFIVAWLLVKAVVWTLVVKLIDWFILNDTEA